MRRGLIPLVFAGALVSTSAFAQVADLSGKYRCFGNCLSGDPAYATQSGWDVNLVNEVGHPSRAWIDRPGHIWAEGWRQGAVISADGSTIQFDNGAIWQRDFGTPPPVAPVRRARKQALR